MNSPAANTLRLCLLVPLAIVAVLVAVAMMVLPGSAAATPSPTPSATLTPSPTPTSTPSPSFNPSPTPLVSPPRLNHFKCYAVQPQASPARTQVPIEFIDQFGSNFQQETLVLDEFCNPVEKTHNGNVSPITNPDSHMSHYRLIPPEPQPVRIVDIQNQFGPQQLILTDASSAFIPAQIQPYGPPFNLSHFLCYVAVGPPVAQTVDLVDQFHAEPGVSVMQPDYFCNPAEKIFFPNDYPLLNPDDHLACYRITPQPFTMSVTFSDQFQTANIQVLPSNELCVPSLTLAVSTPTIPATPLPTPSPTPTSSPSPTPSPTLTVCGACGPPPSPGAVGGLVDVVTTGGGDGGGGMTVLFAGLLLAFAATGAAAVGFRRASIRR